jgi:hypothetical protein
MKADASKYLHILPFECPRCHKPVLEWTFSSMRNLESVDATAFHPKCSCGWTGRWLGAQARGHAVLPWSGPESNHEHLDQEQETERDTGNRV